MKHILVIGGNRFVGKKIASLLATHNKVSVLNRSGTGPEDVTKIQCDRDNIDKLAKILSKNKFDIIIDMCGYNQRQIKALDNALTYAPSQYIFISSLAAICPGFGKYGEDKLAVERYLTNSAKRLRSYIIRPAYIIGSGDPYNRIQGYVNALKANEPVIVHGDGTHLITISDADDIVNSIQSAIISNETRIIDNSIGYITTPIRIIGVICDKLNLTPRIEFGETDVFKLPLVASNNHLPAQIIEKYI